jgi:hypothetical protein
MSGIQKRFYGNYDDSRRKSQEGKETGFKKGCMAFANHACSGFTSARHQGHQGRSRFTDIDGLGSVGDFQEVVTSPLGDQSVNNNNLKNGTYANLINAAISRRRTGHRIRTIVG